MGQKPSKNKKLQQSLPPSSEISKRRRTSIISKSTGAELSCVKTKNMKPSPVSVPPVPPVPSVPVAPVTPVTPTAPTICLSPRAAISHQNGLQNARKTITSDIRNSMKKHPSVEIREEPSISDLEDVPRNMYVENIKELFEFHEQLGKGASCQVFRVTHRGSGISYALKWIFGKKKSGYRLFEKEVNALCSVDHPNIVNFLGGFKDNQDYYILTELCTGGRLFDRIKKVGRMSEQQAGRIIRTICEVCDACHRQNLVHRDLKLENIMFDAYDEVVVIDFGQARTVDPEEIITDYVGTVSYFAPEFFRKRSGEELKKSDMWAVGVITYMLVVGKRPFYGHDKQQTFLMIHSGKYTFPDDLTLSWECKHFISSCLSLKPSKRMNAQQALNHIWLKSVAPSPNLVALQELHSKSQGQNLC